MMDKGDDDYEDSYWEYLDIIIAHRKANPEPPVKKTDDIWRDIFKLYEDKIDTSRRIFSQSEWIEICKKNWNISERSKN